MYNALEEGGPRNGVMTGVDDFVAEHDKPLRVVVLPIYFGLAIVVEEERLARQPELAAELDRLESAEGRGRPARGGRGGPPPGDDLPAQRVLPALRAARPGDRPATCGIVKAALLERALPRPRGPVRAAERPHHRRPGRWFANELRDPARNDQIAYRRVAPQPPRPGRARRRRGDVVRSRTPRWAAPQLDHLERCLDAVRTDEVPGDLVECGTGRGGGAIFMRAYLDAHELPDRQVWVSIAFRSAPEPAARSRPFPRQGVAGFRADLNLVRDGFERFDLLDDRVRFLQGLDGRHPRRRAHRADRAPAHRPQSSGPRSRPCSTRSTTGWRRAGS